jgi:hypothetical protein
VRAMRAATFGTGSFRDRIRTLGPIGPPEVRLTYPIRGPQLRSFPSANIIARTMSGGQLLQVPYPEQEPGHAGFATEEWARIVVAFIKASRSHS